MSKLIMNELLKYYQLYIDREFFRFNIYQKLISESIKTCHFWLLLFFINLKNIHLEPMMMMRTLVEFFTIL